MFLPIDPKVIPPEDDEKRVAAFEDWIKWMELHGVTLFRTDTGSLQASIPIACTKLTDDKMCGVFGTDERPEMCATYPQSGVEIMGLEDVCTYKFAKIHPGANKVGG